MCVWLWTRKKNVVARWGLFCYFLSFLLSIVYLHVIKTKALFFPKGINSISHSLLCPTISLRIDQMSWHQAIKTKRFHLNICSTKFPNLRRVNESNKSKKHVIGLSAFVVIFNHQCDIIHRLMNQIESKRNVTLAFPHKSNQKTTKLPKCGPIKRPTIMHFFRFCFYWQRFCPLFFLFQFHECNATIGFIWTPESNIITQQ